MRNASQKLMQKHVEMQYDQERKLDSHVVTFSVKMFISCIISQALYSSYIEIVVREAGAGHLLGHGHLNK